MTERKPAGMPFTSWIDQRISDAQDRGAFDDLPGAGKPLPLGKAEFDGYAWALDWVRREGGSPEDCLPTPLRLRKERERLTADVPGLRSAQEVRDRADELNHRIMAWRRLPIDGPPIVVPRVDTDELVRLWHDHQARARARAPAGDATAEAKTSGKRRFRSRGKRLIRVLWRAPARNGSAAVSSRRAAQNAKETTQAGPG
ncbi:MAG TPA: DUF1992 domain-containing protein [Streptosporangiaceae bacterium]|nr:DUF1992 domain-containing protein [Streptosporangiaceae bacterium]